MKSPAKWLVVGGAFLLFLAFFVPVVFVRFVTEIKCVTLLNLASDYFILYLFPLGALVVLILALIPANIRIKKNIVLIGQVGALGLSLISLVGALTYLGSGKERSTIEALFSPKWHNIACNVASWIGFIVLLLGYGLAALGLAATHFPLLEGHINKKHIGQATSPESLSPGEQVSEAVVSRPQLEFKEGKLAGQIILIKGENFTIGRGRDNNLQLQNLDRKISRVHAQIRFAQNTWFIQDQDSKIGTFINGKRVKATRLSSGDEIRIGEYTFIFRI